MRSKTAPPPYLRIGLVSLSLGVPFFTGCGVHANIDFTTTVQPLQGEDLAGPCTYDIYLPALSRPQQGVLVIYERGDSSVLFNSSDVRQMAGDIDYAMIFAHQCNAATYDDIQSDPAEGPGRALFTALNQFAVLAHHSELSTSNVILYGFSAAGVLAAEMSSFAPNRVLGLVAYAAGSAQNNIETFRPVLPALNIPSLFLDNSIDAKSGTYRSLAYFKAGRLSGAKWGFGVQDGVGHCCNATTINLVLPWIQAVGTPLTAAVGSPNGIETAFVCSLDGTIDAQGDQDCSISSASLGSPLVTGELTAWLPSSAAATEWLTWVKSLPAAANEPAPQSMQTSRPDKHATRKSRFP